MVQVHELTAQLQEAERAVQQVQEELEANRREAQMQVSHPADEVGMAQQIGVPDILPACEHMPLTEQPQQSIMSTGEGLSHRDLSMSTMMPVH